jgi:hypothetical protein
MKKLATFVAALTMAVPVPLVFSTPAQAAANTAVGFCKEYVAAGYDPNLTVGQCVSLLTTGDNYYNGNPGDGYATHVCQYYLNNYPDAFYSIWDSLPDCIQDLHSQV